MWCDALSYLFTQLGGGDVVERGVDYLYALDGLRVLKGLKSLKGGEGLKGVRGNVVAWTSVDEDFVTLEYLFVLVPSVEALPVVGSYDKDELVLRICLGELVEGIEHIGWKRQMVLEIGCPEPWDALYGKLCHAQTVVVGRELGGLCLLEGVEGGYKKPYFIDQALLNKGLG